MNSAQDKLSVAPGPGLTKITDEMYNLLGSQMCPQTKPICIRLSPDDTDQDRQGVCVDGLSFQSVQQQLDTSLARHKI